jgi:hypothetical protein
MLSAAGQGYKDPMHSNEHGNSMLTVKCTVIKLRNLGDKLKVSQGALVKRLQTRLLNLCNSPSVQHTTLLTLGNQKILEGLEVIDRELRTKTKTRGQPIVDANDVAKLLLTLMFVLDGLGKPELDAYNCRQVQSCLVCNWCAAAASDASL